MKFFLGFSIANHVKGNKKPKTSYLGAWHYLVVDNSLKHTVYNHLSVFWRASLPFWSSHLHVLIRTLSKYAQLKLWLYFLLTWLDYTCVLWLYNEKNKSIFEPTLFKALFLPSGIINGFNDHKRYYVFSQFVTSEGKCLTETLRPSFLTYVYGNLFKTYSCLSHNSLIKSILFTLFFLKVNMKTTSKLRVFIKISLKHAKTIPSCLSYRFCRLKLTIHNNASDRNSIILTDTKLWFSSR